MDSPMIEPTVLDSLPRMIGWLSLLGNRDVHLDGRLVTKGRGRIPVEVTSSFFRKFVCVDGCFVCCAVLSVTLDYLPGETAWVNLPGKVKDDFQPRVVTVNGRGIVFVEKNKRPTQRQRSSRETDGSPYCDYLKPVRENGGLGCSLWQTGSPLGCATAYNMRVTEHSRGIVRVTKQGLSRAWRYDPKVECEFHDVDYPDIDTNIRLFKRLIEWAEILDLQPSADRIKAIVRSLEEVLRSRQLPEETLTFP